MAFMILVVHYEPLSLRSLNNHSPATESHQSLLKLPGEAVQLQAKRKGGVDSNRGECFMMVNDGWLTVSHGELVVNWLANLRLIYGNW